MPNPSRVDISVIVPAKNEEKRLPRFLSDLISFCTISEKAYEIIVVDDGSVDKTAEVAEGFRNQHPNLNVITLEKNYGKGYAVRNGMLQAKGDVVLFLDADGSTHPREIENNLHYLKEGYDMVVGSRVLRDGEHRIEARIHRKCIGAVFRFFVRTFLLKDIRDTQCGFKMFRQEIIRPVFDRVHLHGFGFDMEVLFLAHKKGYKIKEAPINWHHVHGSKVNLFTDSLYMFFNILQIRFWHR